MNENIRQLTQTMEYNSPASEETLRSVESEIDMVFPAQYREFMLETNGAEGPIGENSYLAIWSIEEIVPLNKDGKVEEFTPGLVQFASDGGGVAYAFDKRAVPPTIVEIPFDSIDIDDAVKIADTIEGFIVRLYQE